MHGGEIARDSTSQSSTITIGHLRGILSPSQRKLLNLFWNHFLEYGQWPATFEIHRKFEREKTTEWLRSVGGKINFAGNIVRESNGSTGTVYELSLAGILLTKDGKLYEKWIVGLLDFLRKKFYRKTKDGDNGIYDEKAIGAALKLSEEQKIIFGEVLKFASPYQSHSHTVGHNWRISLPKQIEEIRKNESIDLYCKKKFFSPFKYESWVYPDERPSHTFGVPAPFGTGFDAADVFPQIKNSENSLTGTAKIFISHSAQDRELVVALTDLLKSAFTLPAKDILCTSVPGHKLPGGVDTEEELLALLQQTQLLIGLLTPASLRSSYVLFELGARWGLRKPLIPIIASGSTMHDIKEPLKATNALDATNEADVHQLVENVGSKLKLKSEPASAIDSKVRGLVNVAKIKKLSVALVKKEEPIKRESLESQLDWPQLIWRMTMTTKSSKGGVNLFYELAEHHGLNPYKETPKNANWSSVTCAGLTLIERVPLRSIFGNEKNETKELYREYEFALEPKMLVRTSPVIDAWWRQNEHGLLISIRFVSGVTMEPEAHRIKANIFETDLKMPDKDRFEYKDHCFELRRIQSSFDPVLDTSIYGNLSAIPWSNMFTELVKGKVLLIDKKLSKEIWI